MAPTRSELERQSKNNAESFKEYARRWRSLAARVRPSLNEKEMTELFMGTLKSPFVEHMLACSSSRFGDLVIIGDRIEDYIKKGVLGGGEKKGIDRKGTGKQKEVEVATVNPQGSIVQPQYPSPLNQQPIQPRAPFQPYPVFHYPSQPVPPNPLPPHPTPFPPHQTATTPLIPTTQIPSNPTANPRPRSYFPPLPASPLYIFRHLKAAGKIEPIPQPPIRQPLPPSYNPQATCEYHSNAPGHTTNSCIALRRHLQQAIDAGKLRFTPPANNSPNIETNPLPNYQSQNPGGVNSVETEQVFLTWSDERAPAKELIFRALVAGGHMKSEFLSISRGCKYDGATDHNLETCDIFAKKVKQMILLGILQLPSDSQRADANIIETGGDYASEWYDPHGQPHYIQIPPTRQPINNRNGLPFTIPSSHLMGSTLTRTPNSLLMENGHTLTLPPSSLTSSRSDDHFTIPLPTPYNQADVHQASKYVVSSIPQTISNSKNLPQPEPHPRAKHNIILATFAPESIRPDTHLITRSGKHVNPNTAAESSGAKDQRGVEICEESSERPMLISRNSEYSIIEQLNRTPARISMLALIRTSEKHRNMLKKILGESYVDQEITTEGFSGIVSNIQAINHLSFSDDEIDPAGRGHTKALHITVRCQGNFVSRVLVDNGSSINVMPRRTLGALSVNNERIREDTISVRAFDGTTRISQGIVTLIVTVGGHPFSSVFRVLDISPNYTMLLGRPWIHTAGAVPSTLHQRLKFVIDNKLIVVKGEEEVAVSTIGNLPCVDENDRERDLSFTSFEIVNTTVGLPNPGKEVNDTTFQKLLQAGHPVERTQAKSEEALAEKGGIAANTEEQEAILTRKKVIYDEAEEEEEDFSSLNTFALYDSM